MKTRSLRPSALFIHAVQLALAGMSLATTGFAADPGSYGLEAARKSIARMRTAEGLAVRLFAAEPMVQNPTNLDIDSKGRVWFTEAANYRRWGSPPIRPEGDRVMVLEDTNNDGEADKATVFYQDPSMDSALGICVLGNQVIVSVAPHVFLLTDTDGDGKADKRQLLLTGKSTPQHDHSLHAFVFGTDGKLYFNFGNTGSDLRRPTGELLNLPLHGVIEKELIEKNSEPILDLLGRPLQNGGKPYHQGMVFRADFHDGKLSNFETLAHNFRNNYEVTVDSFGNIWQSDNDDDGNRGVRINYVLEHGNYGYRDELTGSGWQTNRINLEADIPRRHWHQDDPGVVPNLLLTGSGSPTGILFNEGTLLGPAFTNQLIHCDAGPRVVRAYPTAPDGAGFKASITDILTSEDTWYRPADVAIAPDGALFVADWYDSGVGGHSMADNQPDSLRGRIYRIAPPGAPVKNAAPDLSNAAGAITAFQSPNRETQFLAWQKLHALGKSAQPDLEKLFASPNPRMRARALSLLSRIPGNENHALEAALNDSDSGVVILAIRLATVFSATHQLDTSVLESKPGLIGKLLRHRDPQVRRQVAISLHGAKQIEQLWAELALQHDGKDRWYLEALGIGAAGQEDVCYAAWIQRGGNPQSPAGQDIVWRLRSAQCAKPLAAALDNPSVAESDKPRLMRAFDFLPRSAERQDALQQIATGTHVPASLVRHALFELRGTEAIQAPSIQTVINEAFQKSVGTPEFVQFAAAFGLGNRAAELLNTLEKISGTPEAEIAIQLLEKNPEGSGMLKTAFSGPKALSLVDLLATVPSAPARDRLVKMLRSDQREMRVAAVRALARSQSGAEALVSLANKNQFPDDLRDTASEALALIQFNDRDNKLKTELSKHFALGGGKTAASSIPAIAELMSKKGDRERGRAVFNRLESSCVTCHKIGTTGADFGPNLSEIGTKLGRDALYDAILNPNNGISMGFETYLFSLSNGTPAVGILRSETEQEITLALPGGSTQRLRKSDVKKREKLPHSMMPNGLGQILGEQNLVDLVEYLSACKAK